MDKRESVETLVRKHGAIGVSRFYLRAIRGALSNIRNGIETNNFALAAKDVGLLAENLANIEIIFGMDDKTLEQIQHLEKDIS